MYKFMVLMSSILVLVQCDVYLHSMRGSNNRLNEQSANRKNANRLFDSQNNNRGGYNAGDQGSEAANSEGEQYRMKFFQSSSIGAASSDGNGQSYLTLEWTNQHGCGGNEESDPHKQNCNIVLQYMCQEDTNSPTGTKSEDHFRNGQETNTPEYTKVTDVDESSSRAESRRNGDIDLERGYHEPWAWYDKCYVRERNQGLFTADQNLKKNSLRYSSAIYTRQNPNGNRYGYECPEERDYYPYWHPSPWMDIAVLTDNTSLCQDYESSSFNVQPYHECIELWSDNNRKHYSRWNNQADCEANDGVWTLLHSYLEKAPQYQTERACEGVSGSGVRYIWAVPYDTEDGTTKQCLVALPTPQCQQAPWSRSNHLGNGRDGVASNYTWTLPYFPSREQKRCVFRIRYNISTDDYAPHATDSRHNQQGSVQSPVQQNPYVEVDAGLSPLRLAINTAQLGRTFQDRSHVFVLAPRPDNMQSERVYNLNVRGKRGNIVQTYPGVEYDFHPNTLAMRDGDLVHVQWTGSNRHDNGNPAGDGQAGDDGEGRDGTDRSNIVQIPDRNSNYPTPREHMTMWTGAEVKWMYHGETGLTGDDLAISMMSSGYYMCVHADGCPRKAQSAERKDLLNSLLDNAPASYEGAVVRFRKGTYHYMCTRNNNFTNRSQKGTIIVA